MPVTKWPASEPQRVICLDKVPQASLLLFISSSESGGFVYLTLSLQGNATQRAGRSTIEDARQAGRLCFEEVKEWLRLPQVRVSCVTVNLEKHIL